MRILAQSYLRESFRVRLRRLFRDGLLCGSFLALFELARDEVAAETVGVLHHPDERDDGDGDDDGGCKEELERRFHLSFAVRVEGVDAHRLRDADAERHGDEHREGMSTVKHILTPWNLPSAPLGI